jgi:hypothetical protein
MAKITGPESGSISQMRGSADPDPSWIGNSVQEIHQKGLDEVARIEEEMKEILEEMGFSNLTLPQFIDMIRYVASFKFVLSWF